MGSRRRHEPCVTTPRSSRLVLQYRFKQRAPSGRKGFGPQCALESIAGMIRRIKEWVDRCDRHSLVRLSHLHDLVTSAHFAFVQDAEVEPGPSAGRQQCGHPGLAHPNADAIAGNARLSDLEQRAADLIAIADAHLILGQSSDLELLAELPVDEVDPLQLLLPIAIAFDLVDENGSFLPPSPARSPS